MSRENQLQLVFLMNGAEMIGYTNITESGNLEIENPRIIAFDEEILYFYTFSPFMDEEEQPVLLFQSNAIMTTAIPSKALIEAYDDMVNDNSIDGLKPVEDKTTQNVVQFNLPNKDK